MALEIGGGISIGGGINVGHTTTFTISSSDFTQGQAIGADTVPQGINGNEGFINTVAQSNLDQGYVGLNLTVGAVETLMSDTILPLIERRLLSASISTTSSPP